MSDKLPAWIPQDVSDALKEAAASGWHGKVEIHFNDGQAAEVHATRRVKIRRKSAGPAAPHCPECQREMESRDYGNIWICACGAKRTKAQMALRGVVG